MIPQHGVDNTIMTIRPLGPADARAFRVLRVRALGDHPEAFGRTPKEVDSVEMLAERFRVDADSDVGFVLGAFDGDSLVGITGCHRERLIKHRHKATVWGVYVAPERRGTGLGRQLFVAVVARARPWPGLESLWLDVTTTNAGARALYARCGFRTVAIRPRTLKVGKRYYDEELMVLDLRGRAPARAAGSP
jgi:ribosomal protein S18 acetylase RimI-like enzyme